MSEVIPSKDRKPFCVAESCASLNVNPSKGVFFCPTHAINVPRHLRKAIEQEVVWLARKGMQLDQHAVALITVAANREYATRLMKDPVLLAEWQKKKAEEVARQSAEASGIILPPKVGELVETPG